MQDSEAAAGGVASGKKCILLVEADIVVRQPITQFLRECGYLVVGAATTDEAADFMNAGHPVDVVLADVESTGKLNGFGLARWIRELGLPVTVILAATVAKAAEKAGGLCEESSQVSKPYHPQFLLQQIKALTAHRQESSS